MSKALLILIISALLTMTAVSAESNNPVLNVAFDESLVPLGSQAGQGLAGAENNLAAAENRSIGAVVKKSPKELSAECAYKYECRPRGEHVWYDCFFDPELGDCRCFVGDFGQCRINKSSLNAGEKEEKLGEKEKGDAQVTGGAVSNTGGNAATIAIVGVIALFVLIFVVSRVADRNTPKNNFARARHYHKLGEKHHRAGDEKKAKQYYELSDKFRKRAEAQL